MTTDQDALDAANRRGPISLQTACALIGLMLFSVGVSILLSGPKQSGAFFVFYPVFLLTGLLLVLYDLRTSPISSPCDEKKNVKNADINETGNLLLRTHHYPTGCVSSRHSCDHRSFSCPLESMFLPIMNSTNSKRNANLLPRACRSKWLRLQGKYTSQGDTVGTYYCYVTETHSQEWFPVLIDDYQKTKEGDSIPVYVLPPRNEIIPVNFELDNHQPASSILFYYFAFLGAYYLGLRRYLLPC